MTDSDISNFRTERYANLNRLRWEQFLSMNLPLEGKTVFEPGAGIGDQTEWLLAQGVKCVYVNEGRRENMEIIRERFGEEPRVVILPVFDLESVVLSNFVPSVDFVFCYGVYYHLNDFDYRIMHGLSEIGNMIALDYLVGSDAEVGYGYDNTSVSLSGRAYRPRTESLLTAMKHIWGYAYTPKTQLDWTDPVAAEQRLIAVASKFSLANEQLEQFCSDLVVV